MQKHIKIFSLFLVVIGFLSCDNENSEIGDRYFQEGEYEKAVSAYTEYLRMQPKDIKTLYNRGRAYEELGQYEKALEDFHHIANEDPLNTNALLSITSDFYYRQKDYENTIYHADKVLKLNPSSSTALNLKGKSYQKMGSINEAMEAYNSAISVNKEYVDAYISRGSLNIYLKRISRACADFKMAKSLGSEKAKELVSKYCK